jgi:predicted nucleotidyltransferase
MKTNLPQRAMITQLALICEQNTRIAAAMLYGPVATGEEDQYSDIDVMRLEK